MTLGMVTGGMAIDFRPFAKLRIRILPFIFRFVGFKNN